MVTPVFNPSEFEPLVRDCLLHFYDYVYLQDHPLLDQIVPGATGVARVQTFRQAIMDAIDRLRPPSSTDFFSKEARSYNILTLRYVERMQAQSISEQLAISDRQFSRDHSHAIETLSYLLWESIGNGSVVRNAVSDDLAAPPVDSSKQNNWLPELAVVDLVELLAGVIDTLTTICEHYQLLIQLAESTSTAVVQTDPTVLRQIVLWLVTQIIKVEPSDATLVLSSEIWPHEFSITVRLEQISTPETPLALPNLYLQPDTFMPLMESIQGRLDFSIPGQVILSVPDKQSILVIDDNPDIIALFLRYLIGHPARVIAAYEADQGVTLARQIQPELIILDVMMPGRDGWQVLQTLLGHPETCTIPVLVCSMLDVADLAKMLGASGFLKKTPTQSEFLGVLAQWRI